jgi:hypothetical protein
MDLSLLVLLAKSRLNPASEDLDMTRQQRAENNRPAFYRINQALTLNGMVFDDSILFSPYLRPKENQ